MCCEYSFRLDSKINVGTVINTPGKLYAVVNIHAMLPTHWHIHAQKYNTWAFWRRKIWDLSSKDKKEKEKETSPFQWNNNNKQKLLQNSLNFRTLFRLVWILFPVKMSHEFLTLPSTNFVLTKCLNITEHFVIPYAVRGMWWRI